MLKAVSPTTNVLFHLMKFYWFTINGKKVMKSTFYSVPESHRICHVVFGIHISLGTSFLTWAYPALLGMTLTFWRVLADCLEVCLSTGLCPFFLMFLFQVRWVWEEEQRSKALLSLFSGFSLLADGVTTLRCRVSLPDFVICLLWKVDTVYTVDISRAERYGYL